MCLVLLNGSVVDQEIAGELVARVPSLEPTKKWERRASPQGCPVTHVAPVAFTHTIEIQIFISVILGSDLEGFPYSNIIQFS